MISAAICPLDCGECLRSACASGWCERTGERALSGCADCGTPDPASTRVFLCAICVEIPASQYTDAN
jgi:hypothetical protein